jgi:MFS family permease
MYIQLNLEDTEAFKELAAHRNDQEKDEQTVIQKSPVIEAMRKYPKRIVLAAGAFLNIQVTFYILIAFLLAYGVQSANMERDDMLTAVLIASAIMVPVQFLFSSYSDRHGRRGIFMLGAVLSGLWAFAVFPLVDSGNFWLIVLAVSGGLVFLAMMYGPQAAFFTELFSTEVRYSGATLGYQFGAILGGAFAPTIAVKLWTELDIFFVSVYMAFSALLTLLSVMALTETYQSDLNKAE